MFQHCSSHGWEGDGMSQGQQGCHLLASPTPGHLPKCLAVAELPLPELGISFQEAADEKCCSFTDSGAGWVWKEPQSPSHSSPLPRAGTPSIKSGCTKPCPTWSSFRGFYPPTILHLLCLSQKHKPIPVQRQLREHPVLDIPPSVVLAGNCDQGWHPSVLNKFIN